MLRWFYLGMGCLLVAAALHAGRGVPAGEREPWGGFAARLDDGPAVLVFHVRDPASLAMVRAAVAAERIVAERPDGFALREGRIVAVGPEASAALLAQAGWSDRPLELHQPAPQPPPWAAGGGAPGGARTLPNALAHQSHLSRAEATAVMEQLD